MTQASTTRASREVGRYSRWLHPISALLLGACQSGADADPKPKSSGSPAPPTQVSETTSQPASKPSLPPTPAGWHEGLTVSDEELATVQDFEAEAEKTITPSTWQTELEKLAKELGE